MDNVSRPAVVSRTPEMPRTLFQCRVCKKGYDRADYLKRHVKSHTTDKPFVCEQCGKGFMRIELHRRHTQSHSSEMNRDEAGGCLGIAARASRACKRCAGSKLKCDDDKPCRRCVRRNQICQWTPKDDTFATQESHVNTMEHELNSTKQTGKDLLDNAQARTPSDNSGVACISEGESAKFPETERLWQEWEGFNLFNAFPPMGPGQSNSCDSMSIDFGLRDQDFELLYSLNTPAAARQAQNYTGQLPPKIESSRQISSVDLQDSPLSHWTPCKEDNAHMDQKYLSLPQHLDNPQSQGVLDSQNLTYPLSTASRDAAFALVVKICRWKNLDRMMQCFPSTKLLGGLIANFFIHHRSEPDAWIHEPTIDLNQERPEMILSLAAAGAVLSNVEAIQRLGYALLEVARLKVNSMFEDDNTLTRDLKQQQMYTLALQIGLWSGDKRRVEIAESCFQPIVTMLRRASRFKHEVYPIVAPSATDDKSTVNRKWRVWVEHESFKRLAHYVFIHDAQTSSLRSVPPIISHIEFDLPLPFSRKLWDAKTAAEWKAIYIEEIPQSPSILVSLSTILQDITTFSSVPRHADFQLAAMATIYGISNMISDCNRILRGSTRQWSTAVANLWQQELVQLLEQFQFLAVEPLEDSLPALSLIHQTVSLSLYLPLGILETFSGKDSEERSSAIYQSFIQHISPTILRKASWHAGQILRIARSMPPGSLVASRAACVYFSALAMWSLATVFSLKGMAPVVENNSTDELFFLDGKDDGDVLRRFTTLGQGSPVLSSVDRYVHLQDRGAVTRLFQELFRSEHSSYGVDQQGRALSHAFAILGRNGDAEAEYEDIQY